MEEPHSQNTEDYRNYNVTACERHGQCAYDYSLVMITMTTRPERKVESAKNEGRRVNVHGWVGD